MSFWSFCLFGVSDYSVRDYLYANILYQNFLRFTPPFTINYPILLPLYAGVMGCGAAEVTGLGFVCFVVISLCVLSANRVDLIFFLFHKFCN